MDKLIARLQKIINHLPGPGKLIFGALVADRKAFDVLVACIVAVFATYLQPPVLSLYTPIIQQGLRTPGSGTPLFVAAGYLLLAVLTLVGGASGDIFGRKRFLQMGLFGVLMTNLFGMIFLNSPNYILINTLNTIATVVVMPMTVAIVTIAFPVQVRPFAYGAIFGTQGAALIIASSLNAIALDAGVQWMAFIPAIAVAVLAIRLVRRDTQESRAPIGTSRQELFLNVVWASAIFGLVYGLIAFGGGLTERNIWIIVAICILGFVIGYRWIMRRLRGRVLKLYNVRDLSFAILAGIMLSVGQASFFYQIGSYFQKIQQVGPVESGLRLVPFVLAMIIATFLIVRLSMRFDARWLISGGISVMAIGTALLFFLQPDTPYWQLILPIAIMGLGFGIATPARTVVVLTIPPPGIVGVSAGINTAAGQSGFTLGTIISSILVTVFANRYFVEQLVQSQVPLNIIKEVDIVFQDVFARVISGNLTHLPDSLVDKVTVSFSEAFSVGLGHTYLVIALLLVATAAVIFVGMTKGLKGTLISQPIGTHTLEPAHPNAEPLPPSSESKGGNMA